MRAIRRAFTAWPLLLGLAAIAGCDSDCGNPSRIDGDYEVWSNAVGDGVVFTGLEDDEATRTEILQAAFPNGASSWSITYVPANGKIDLVIDEDQPFTATYEESPDNCNAFSMQFSGMFISEAGANHQFTWQGDLVYMGGEITGTFSYSDTWTHPDGQGSLEIPEGEIQAVLGGG